MTYNTDNITNISWQLPNRKYYPDDPAPPVPNMDVISIGDSYQYLGNNSVKPREWFNFYRNGRDVSEGNEIPTNEHNFVGSYASKDFDYRNGVQKTVYDHEISSRLNVDAVIPSWTIEHSGDIFNYTHNLIPALCGIYTIDVPENGVHLGYIQANYARRSFLLNQNNDLQGNASNNRSLNRENSVVRNIGAVDLIIAPSPNRATAINYNVPTVYEFSNFRLRVYLRGSRYQYITTSPVGNLDNFKIQMHVEFYDKVSNAGYVSIVDVSDVGSNHIDLRYPLILRLNIIERQLEFMFYETSENTRTLVWNNAPIPQQSDFGFISYYPDPDGQYLSVSETATQIISYNNPKPLEEQYADLKLNRRIAGNIVYDDIDEFWVGEEFFPVTMLPAYRGNVWSYLQNLSTLLPYRGIL